MPPTRTRLRTVRPDGTPVYRYVEDSGVPPIGLVSFDHTAIDGLPPNHRHAHDFLVLVYVERGVGSVRIDDVEHRLADGEVIPIAPGRMLGSTDLESLRDARCYAVYFLPGAVLGSDNVPSPLTWGEHPLLSAFAPARSREPGALAVPAADRRRWSAMFSDLQDELADPGRTGFREAVSAALTRILVGVARLADSSGRENRIDPLVSRFFRIVERDFTQPISTRDVAAELGYTAGHLTTVIRERTGRTVLDWITERRLTQARRLLADTDLGFDAVARRSGLGDAGYLGRRFRSRYGMTPLAWRRAQRLADPAGPQD
ncbi:helix-turn-helix domain-containing protein [Microlunatus sp. Gsoil 973]|nr:helix-turn-helix domain-containing protein [Microlunatus sp. Gsoil 973]